MKRLFNRRYNVVSVYFNTEVTIFCKNRKDAEKVREEELNKGRFAYIVNA